MVSFVQLTVADALLLAEIGKASLLESHGHSAPAHIMQEYADKNFTADACRAELADVANIFYAVFYKDQPAGYSKITFDYPQPATTLHPITKLERLYLLKAFYDRKLGHALLRKAIDLSQTHEERGMWLNVWKENHRAIRFYQKQGFEIIGESSFELTVSHANPNHVMLLRY